MPKTAKTQEVREALKYFVELNPNMTVDEDNYVIVRKSEDYVRVGPSSQPIILYSEQITDTTALILNPFAEGLGSTHTSTWFYKSLRVPMQLRIGIILRHAIQMALEHQEGKKPAKKTTAKKSTKETSDGDTEQTRHIPSDVLHIVSGIVNSVDEKMLEEVSSKLSRTLPDLFQVAYYRNTQTTQFRSTLMYDPEQAYELMSPIRKKTITVMNTILAALFDVKTHDELVDMYKARHIQDAPSKMSSYLKCLYKIYDQINPILVQFGDKMAIDDMESFDYHLHRLPNYTMNAKFMASPSVKETASQQPANQSVPDMGVPMPNQQQPQPNVNTTPCGVPLPQQNTQGMMPLGGQQPLPQAQPNPQMGGGFGLVPTVSTANMGGMPQQQNPGFMPQQQAAPSFAPQQPFNVPQQQQYVSPQSGIAGAPPAWRGFV